MTEQFPEVDYLKPPPVPKTCQWCGDQATTELEVKPASYTTNHHDQKVMKTKPIMARVCAPCKRRLEGRYA